MKILKNLGQYGLLGQLILGSLLMSATTALADSSISANGKTPNNNLDSFQASDHYSNQDNALEQITSVSELKDVAPTEWAYEALRSLVERYGCIVGYPDSTYRGDRALSRWEFAAGLNACMNTIERLIQENVAVLKEDIDTLKRLAQEFEAELAALGGRVDNLESRVSFLEDHQFSTTTKLTGEVVFGVAGASNNGGTDNQVVFQNRVRLYLETSFTGEDVLYTGLAAGNSPRFELPSQGDVQTSEGTLSFQDYGDNDVSLDYLSYFTPIGDSVEVFATAAYGATSDYLPTAGNDPIDDGGDGGSGALTLFGAHNSIYYIGGGSGAGMNFKFGDIVTLSASYLAGPTDPASSAEGAGIFNGDYAALGQVTITPTEDLSLALTYVNSYHTPGTSIFSYGAAKLADDYPGAVGTSFANFPGGTDASVAANSFGVGASYRIGSKFVVSAWGGYTIADILNSNTDDGEIWNYALTFAFPDLLKEGNLGGLIVGVQPYLGNPRQVGIDASNSLPLHIEAFYRYQLNDNISITPGLVYLNAPDQQDKNDAFIGVVRTTFTF
ncbi:iron uptake porin [Candidatus Gracilibacteria bacterium]|nr:iron uptake porin [Candidatus Gracilibacteria bacterium]NJM87493.1 iron uptake porin [Hydrococcus sp. RU_2_2]NJP18195.1 iron uptake porin [Hydrococcus sp. CRU_1_1]